MTVRYLSLMQTQDYINNCSAANAYSPTSYPRAYTRAQYDSNMSSRSYYQPARFSAETRRSVPYPPPPARPLHREPTRRPQPPPNYSALKPPSAPPLRRSYISSSSRATPPSPSPPRKSVRFDDSARSKVPQRRPKTFATDAPPAAISESAKETSRRLFHRRPSDGGRPSMFARSESTRSLDTTRAEFGTHVGRSRESGRERERERERRYRDERSSKGRRR